MADFLRENDEGTRYRVGTEEAAMGKGHNFLFVEQLPVSSKQQAPSDESVKACVGRFVG